jgi:hypothetical protein
VSTAQEPPPLRYLSYRELVQTAGGDPWQVNRSLQSGEPGEIAGLAQAFYQAGVTTRQSFDDFAAAKLRFEAAWIRDQGDHPINDAAEVQRATQQMDLQHLQLTDVGIELEEIAASLAVAQRVAAPLIGGLNAVLMSIDAQIGQAVAVNGPQQVIDQLHAQAGQATGQTLREVQAIRDDYSSALAECSTKLRGVDGYSPDILEGIDADGRLPQQDRANAAADQYNHGQRAADQALVDSGGPVTQQLQDARARLRDFATVTDPTADPTARRLAGERLDDFNTATRQGPPLPESKDPILGGDPATRARQRLELQRKFEQADPLLRMPGRSPDAVTAMLDDAEQKAKIMVTRQAIKGLESQGMSAPAAMAAVDHLSQGMSWKDLIEQGKTDARLTDLAGTGAETYAGAQSAGRHAAEGLTGADISAAEKLGGRVGAIGSVAALALAGADVWVNHAPAGKTLGGALGGIGGGMGAGWLAAMGAGSVVGPEGTALVAVLASIAGGTGGEWAGGQVGKWLFDE